MRLISLTLRNFKGATDVTLEANGENMFVFGDNATGKTTLFDAFMWLLFGKDSQNKSQFDIKPQDENGKDIHFLESEVSATLEVHGENLSLRRILTEKWTQKRGSVTSELSGHETAYFIDNVPVGRKTDFDKVVSDLIAEDLFKLITNPLFFNEQLDWKKRREILFELVGDISDEEVISQTPSIAKLRELLGKHNLDNFRKIILARRTEINKEREKIPVRIDEVKRGIPDTSDLDGTILENELGLLVRCIEKKEAEFARIQSGGQIANKEKNLNQIQSYILKIENELTADILKNISEENLKLNEIKNSISEIVRNIENEKANISYKKETLQRLSNEIVSLRNDFKEVNAEVLSFSLDETCPTCEQAMPYQKLMEAKEKATQEFNQNKVTRLEKIRAEGQKKTAQGKVLQDEITQGKEKIDLLSKEKATLEAKQTKIELHLHQLNKALQGSKENVSAEYVQKKAEEVALKQEIAGLKENTSTAIEQVKKELSNLRQSVSEIEGKKARILQVKNAENRIKELEEQERTLAREYERLENELFLTEEFIKAKVNLLEERINSKFEIAKFKLFETQINGGVVEVCKTLYKGVAYDTNLNGAAKVNVGLDIINTLSKHYNVTAPIFIDNRESVTDLIKSDSQIINLVVSKEDNVLRMVTEEELNKLKKEVI